MAMHWTREHVQKFGGDKNKVTIGGMSAGGQSIQGFFFKDKNTRRLKPFMSQLLEILAVAAEQTLAMKTLESANQD